MATKKPRPGYEGVEPYPKGVKTATERIEAGEQREQISSGRSKTAAIDLGRRLLKRMKGRGWQLRVWQNLGWHYMVRKGTIQVYVSAFGRNGITYHTMMGYENAGRPELSIPNDPRFKDPNQAVAAQVRFARKIIARLQADVAGLAAEVR